jgi:hypothetical protein
MGLLAARNGEVQAGGFGEKEGMNEPRRVQMTSNKVRAGEAR